MQRQRQRITGREKYIKQSLDTRTLIKALGETNVYCDFGSIGASIFDDIGDFLCSSPERIRKPVGCNGRIDDWDAVRRVNNLQVVSGINPGLSSNVKESRISAVEEQIINQTRYGL